VWQFKIRLLRKKAKGWSKNREAEIRRSKTNIILELNRLDKLFEQQNLTTQEINVRKELSADHKFGRLRKLKQGKDLET
jgi:hypothetical protein